MKSRRLLVVSNLFPPDLVGGAEIVAHRQALQLAKSGWEVGAFVGGFADAEWPPGSLRMEQAGPVPVFRLPVRSMSVEANFRWPTAEDRLLSVLETHRPDIVHFHNVSGLGASLIPLAKRWGALVVVTLHDHWGFCFKNTLLRNDGRVCADVEDCAQCQPLLSQGADTSVPMRLRRDYVAWCLDQADLLLSPSAYLAKAYGRSGVVRRPVAVLSNGIDLQAVPVSAKAPDTVVKFVSFGYTGEHKGIPSLIAAARLLARSNDLAGRWELCIAGHGHLASWVEQEVLDPALRGVVRYVGRLPHPEALALMDASDAVILASIWPENEPVTLLEAIASGTAQIASRIGGNVELVVDGQSGHLFPPGDADALAAVMERVVREPQQLAAMRAFNAARRGQFDEAATIGRLVEWLDALRPAAAVSDDVIVICDGLSPTSEVQLAIHRLHLATSGERPVRLIWHDWATPALWSAASLLWIWDDQRPLSATRAGDALHAGVATLCPRSIANLPVDIHSEALIAYDSPLDAVGIIAALDEVDPLDYDFQSTLQALARMTNAVAERPTFFLGNDRLA